MRSAILDASRIIRVFPEREFVLRRVESLPRDFGRLGGRRRSPLILVHPITSCNFCVLALTSRFPPLTVPKHWSLRLSFFTHARIDVVDMDLLLTTGALLKGMVAVHGELEADLVHLFVVEGRLKLLLFWLMIGNCEHCGFLRHYLLHF